MVISLPVDASTVDPTAFRCTYWREADATWTDAGTAFIGFDTDAGASCCATGSGLLSPPPHLSPTDRVGRSGTFTANVCMPRLRRCVRLAARLKPPFPFSPPVSPFPPSRTPARTHTIADTNTTFALCGSGHLSAFSAAKRQVSFLKTHNINFATDAGLLASAFDTANLLPVLLVLGLVFSFVVAWGLSFKVRQGWEGGGGGSRWSATIRCCVVVAVRDPSLRRLLPHPCARARSAQAPHPPRAKAHLLFTWAAARAGARSRAVCMRPDAPTPSPREGGRCQVRRHGPPSLRPPADVRRGAHRPGPAHPAPAARPPGAPSRAADV